MALIKHGAGKLVGTIKQTTGTDGKKKTATVAIVKKGK